MKLLLGKIVIVSLLLASMSANAQTSGAVLSLDDCIEIALKNRASIIMARGTEDLAKASQRSALGAFLPQVSASYGYSKGKDTDIEPPTVITDGSGNDVIIDEQDTGPSKSLSVSAGISVFNLSNWFNLFSARSSRRAAGLDVINSEQDLIYSVKLAYYAYLAAQENVNVQERAVTRSEEQLKLIQSRYDLGSASLSDVLKQKVQFGNDRLALLSARNAVVTTKASLAYTVGISPNTEPTFSTEYSIGEYVGNLDDAISFGLANEPGLRAADANVAAARKSINAGYASYLPSVSASYSFTKFNGTQAFPVVFDYSSISRTWGFRVSWNIFDGFSREQRVTSAKVNYNNARAGYADGRNLLVQEIKTAHFDAEQQTQAKGVATENVEAANEDLKITQEKYNLGAATILDLLDAQVSLKRAQVDLIQADFDLNLAVARLENAMGKM